ncbi:LmeA family phospholipid-binding protein [Streptacidiphilus sp. EB129]|uniref:LmeA family phospholipid-binding protein n=1 Tax=Streptacidiphilus sp. EB129 TaxID=3156262 RepID=UPI003519877E
MKRPSGLDRPSGPTRLSGPTRPSGPTGLSGLWVVLRRRRVVTVTSVLALTAVVAAGTGELTVRAVIQDRVAKAAPALGGAVTVHEDGGPVLWDVVTGRIPGLEISSDDAQVGPLPQVTVQARLEGIRLGGGAASVSATHAEVTVPTRSIGVAVQAAVPSMAVTSVTTQPAAGTIVVAIGPGGVGQLTLRPVLADGRVSLTVAGLTVFGRSVPSASLGGLGGGAGSGLSSGRQTYPLGLRATSVQLLPTALRVTLTGGPTPLPAA